MTASVFFNVNAVEHLSDMGIAFHIFVFAFGARTGRVASVVCVHIFRMSSFSATVGTVLRIVAASGLVGMPLYACTVKCNMLVGQFDGFFQQGIDTDALTGYGRVERHIQTTAQFFDVECTLAFFKLIIHVQGSDERKVPFLQLHGEQQIPFQIGCVEHIDDGIYPTAFQFVCHIRLFRTESTDRVGSRQVYQTDFPSIEDHFSHDTADGHSAVVTGTFVSPRGCIEK